MVERMRGGLGYREVHAAVTAMKRGCVTTTTPPGIIIALSHVRDQAQAACVKREGKGAYIAFAAAAKARNSPAARAFLRDGFPVDLLPAARYCIPEAIARTSVEERAALGHAWFGWRWTANEPFVP